MKKFFTATLAGSLLIFLLLLSAASAAPVPPDPYEIKDDPTGGDCSEIGSWDGAAKTCTLTQNIYVTEAHGIEIMDDGIKLDGAGHTVRGSGTHIGIYLHARDSVVVRNIMVENFFAGIELFESSNNIIENNVIQDNDTGLFLFGIAGSDSNHLYGNRMTGNSRSIYIRDSEFNSVDKNVVSAADQAGVGIEGGNSNIVKFNRVSGAATAVELYDNADDNQVYANTFLSNYNGLTIADSSFNSVWNNNFLENSAQIAVSGTSSMNYFWRAAPEGGNYFDSFATAAQGCVDANDDRFCDTAYTSPYGGTDELPLARRAYYFTWYDEVSAGARNWILMTNPVDPGEYPGEKISFDAWFDLLIAGDSKPLSSSIAGDLPGQVVPGTGLTPNYPGVIGGPVEVGYHARMKQMVSQRILWGDSLDEVTGPDAADLSPEYFWSWYDQNSPGFQNWILIGNPNLETVRAEIGIGGTLMSDPVTGFPYFDIPAGGRITPVFPGVIGGPVYVRAYQSTGTWPGDARDVIASQRVLSNNGAAFNEEPGIPGTDLSDHYFWTWYDNQSPGASNWILVANPGVSDAFFEIEIGSGGCGVDPPAGSTCLTDEGTPLAPGQIITPKFDGIINGPVRVQGYSDAGHSLPENLLASQRSIWGPSFEETPGYPDTQLASNYYWTWYDQYSPDVTNWVLVANPSRSPSWYLATFEIKIGDTLMDLDPATSGQQGDYLFPGDVKTYTFPGTISGPVQVISDNNVISSQRVLWKGYFNEVMGTVLD
ncbi:MAG: right-handed parallel beta-helix repeat-containing protein [Thermoleophilia bacterium]|nr:right-handed parallel beta-helix repeat-containing protein [Thermoleophilia bacterium]